MGRTFCSVLRARLSSVEDAQNGVEIGLHAPPFIALEMAAQSSYTSSIPYPPPLPLIHGVETQVPDSSRCHRHKPTMPKYRAQRSICDTGRSEEHTSELQSR